MLDGSSRVAALTTLAVSAVLLALSWTGDGSPERNCSAAFLTATIDSLGLPRAEEMLYVEDGAGDGTVLRSKDQTAELAATLTRCPQEAGPLLIERLDSRRKTSFKSQTSRTGSEGRAVSLGFVCLDVLLHIVVPMKPVFDEDCADDGLGACLNPPYYFRPDSQDAVAITKSKRSWQTLLRAGRLRFQSPAP